MAGGDRDRTGPADRHKVADHGGHVGVGAGVSDLGVQGGAAAGRGGHGEGGVAVGLGTHAGEGDGGGREEPEGAVGRDGDAVHVAGGQTEEVGDIRRQAGNEVRHRQGVGAVTGRESDVGGEIQVRAVGAVLKTRGGDETVGIDRPGQPQVGAGL